MLIGLRASKYVLGSDGLGDPPTLSRLAKLIDTHKLYEVAVDKERSSTVALLGHAPL
jgi:hypothetical protein